jgi:hypothetical protein
MRYNIPRRTHRLVSGPLANIRTASPAVNLGATTASPADYDPSARKTCSSLGEERRPHVNSDLRCHRASNDKATGAGWCLFQPLRGIGRHGPRIPGASREANHVHRSSDEHRAWRDQRRLVASHRLPSGEVALMKRFVISLLRAVAAKISTQVRQPSASARPPTVRPTRKAR